MVQLPARSTACDVDAFVQILGTALAPAVEGNGVSEKQTIPVTIPLNGMQHARRQPTLVISTDQSAGLACHDTTYKAQIMVAPLHTVSLDVITSAQHSLAFS